MSPTSASSTPPADTTFWPEAWRDIPRRPPFPWGFALRWLIPGVAGVLILSVLLIFLQREAGRPIIYLGMQGQLRTVRADGEAAHDVGERPWALDRTGQDRLRRVLPLAGAPSWSPNGRYFAATLLEKGKIQTALFAADTITPTLISSAASDVVALAGAGWSPDGKALALIEHDGVRPLLSVVDVQRSAVVTFSMWLDTRAPLYWHPSGQFLLATGLTQGVTPTLLLANTNGSTGEYVPRDDQVIRADGMWSPDGLNVAYVTPDARRDPKVFPLAGSLWVADSAGTRTQLVVKDGLNLAPVWAPKGDFIFFTRYLTATNSFDLYRVQPNGSNLAQIGLGSDLMVSLPFDRGAWLKWSPDGTRLFFISTDRQRRQVIYTAAYNGAEAKPLAQQCQSTDAPSVRWAPTSRALLVACPAGQMTLHRLDVDRPPTAYHMGQWPAWRP